MASSNCTCAGKLQSFFAIEATEIRCAFVHDDGKRKPRSERGKSLRLLVGTVLERQPQDHGSLLGCYFNPHVVQLVDYVQFSLHVER
jgi:hypothetical protein